MFRYGFPAIIVEHCSTGAGWVLEDSEGRNRLLALAELVFTCLSEHALLVTDAGSIVIKSGLPSDRPPLANFCVSVKHLNAAELL
jgi:hypothetical protein